MTDCEKWLLRFLSDDGKDCESVKTAAKRFGYSMFDLRRARKTLNIVSISSDVPGKHNKVFWYLPDRIPEWLRNRLTDKQKEQVKK